MGWRWGIPPPDADGHTPVKTLPSRILLEMCAVTSEVSF